MSLVNVGPDVDEEKDFCLERFFEWATAVIEQLSSTATPAWSDYIDPCSGLPMVHKFNGSVYSEVQGLTALLGYETSNAGCCKIVLHPQWGAAVYPASLFTNAPLPDLLSAIQAAEKALAAKAES